MLAVAKKKPGRGAPNTGTDATAEYTTMRFYRADGEDLSDLADLLNVTIAELYHELCAPLIRSRRIKALEDKLKDLKS